ncbi:MAG: hypothetical protein HON98_03885 [Chloroflexi bacterium]|jgi:ABC-type Fe3+ transport system permease subunit|nr:hypothetical protein [Chloroflexota bacterium]MBT4754808.1 hypothetical protein [Chloroflexota bacterium]MBT6151560.1 hypothetical protein [Chloroflexota bacterium]MBT6358374.1 hypothetical protein [Chloroflexota bacterium]MBT6835445.1 hypothetical protein [Bacteroidota bacterium]
MEQGKLTINDIKKEIIIAFIVIILIQPITKFIWNFILAIGGSVFNYLIDSIYRNAAYGQRPVDSAILVLVLMAISISQVFPRTIFRRNKSSSQDKEHENIETATVETILRFAKKNIFPVLIRTIYIFCIIYISLMTLSNLQLNTSFEQRLDILSPFISDSDEEVFRSSWGLMNTREDYINIFDDFKLISGENNIVLPDSLWP